MKNNSDKGLVYFLLFAGASMLLGVIIQIILDIINK